LRAKPPVCPPLPARARRPGGPPPLEQQEQIDRRFPPLMSDVVSKVPGFVSGNIHSSADGERVLAYVAVDPEVEALGRAGPEAS
jgi:hypothetical protein